MTSSSSPLVRSSSAAPISASLPPSSAGAPRRERITPSFSRQREGAGGEKRVSLKSSSETRVLCPVRRSGERKEKTKERTAEGVRGKEPPTPKKAKMLANDGRVKVKAEKIFKEVGQLGVGIKGGAEIVVQAMRTWLKKEGRKGRGVLKLDFENAYNRIDREEIGKMVKEFFPELFPWFRFCYGTRAALICQGKRLPFHSCDGVQQGDPLGPLFFALGILRMGKRMKEALAESLSLWYLDDGSIVGPGTELLQAWKIVEEEAKKIGMRLNVEKCEIWAWEGEEEEWMTKFPEQVRRVRESGFELLGCPVGDKDFSEKCAKERVSRVKEVLDRLDVVDDPQSWP